MTQNHTALPQSRGDSATPGTIGFDNQIANETRDPSNFAAVIDSLPILAWTVRHDGSDEFFNRQWLDYTGQTLQAALERTWVEAVHPEDRAAAMDRWRVALKAGQQLEVECRIRRFDGTYRRFLIRANALRDTTGNLLNWFGVCTEIHDHRLDEQATSSGEVTFRQIVDSVPGLLFTYTASGETEFVNRQILDYFGQTLEELQAWRGSDTIHPADLARVTQEWARNIRAGSAFAMEHRLRGADGVYRWFQLRASPYRNSDNQLIRWYGLLIDIDDLRRARQAAQSREEEIRLIVDTIPGLIFTTTTTGEVEFVNRQLLHYFDRTLQDVQVWKSSDAVHPDDRPNTMDCVRRGIQSGQPYEFEQRLRRDDGVYRWFRHRSVPLRDMHGQIVRWYGLLTDIDGLKLAQEVLRSSEQSLRLLVDNIPGLVYTMTPSCELELVNPQLLEYFGRTLEELRDWGSSGCVHQDDLPQVLSSLQRTIEYGEPHEVEHRLRRADGAYRWFKPHGLASRDSNGRITRWYCLLTDIDDLQRAEETLRATQARLSRATHFAAMSELSASIAHEINQPLAAVVANGHACRRWLSAEAPNVERALLSTDRIIRDGNAAADAIQRIRSLFRQAPPSKDLLNVNELVVEVLRLLTDDFHARSVFVRTDLQRDLPLVAADRVQIQQVIMNFARNGIEAMDWVTDRQKTLTITSRYRAQEVSVLVTDEGAGIADAEIVFESFYTTKANGMGMGLAICRSIIEAHGGRLWAQRNALVGASFGFALRAAAQET